MNKNINLVELLKDCPKGTKFYSRAMGTVTFNCIKSDMVCIKNHKGIEIDYAKSGKFYYAEEDAEIDLFPSKDQRDWSKLQRPFVEGDVVMYGDNQFAIFKEYIKHPETEGLIRYYLYYDAKNDDLDANDGQAYVQRLATEEEKATLFQAIKDKGYKWDPETKTLEKVIEPKFKVGDTIRAKYGLQEYKITDVSSEYYSTGIGRSCVSLFPIKDQDDWELVSNETILKFKDEDKNHLWTIQDAKEGDVLAINWYEGYDYWEKIVIFKKYHNEGATSPCVEGYGNTFKNRILAFHEEVPRFSKTWTSCLEPATKEQRDLLFQTIKEAGYKWNSETKTLEKLIVPKFKVGDRIISIENEGRIYTINGVYNSVYGLEELDLGLPINEQDNWELIPNKFDPKTLQPFDKVLVRQFDDLPWCIDFFSFYDEAEGYAVCTGEVHYDYCVPFNDDTKHLVSKTEDAPEFYRYWEDK